jgi:hypothetical protein
MSLRTLSQTKERHILRNNKENFLISLTKHKEARAEKATKQLLEEQMKKIQEARRRVKQRWRGVK